MISSDDALFGHPAFRYVGYAPRMWQWALMMGMRKFQEMVFTGRPFTADEWPVQLRQQRRPHGELEAEVKKYAPACARTRPTDTVFMQKVFFEIIKQHQGEYMGSLLSAWLRIDGRAAAGGRRQRAATLGPGTMDAGLNNTVKDNDEPFPPEWRLSRSGRRRRTADGEPSPGVPGRTADPSHRLRVVDLLDWIAGGYFTKLLVNGGA